MEEITFKKSTNQTAGKIAAIENAEEVGHIDFSLKPEELIVEHTEVHPDKRGSDLAETLVQKVLDYSESQNLEISSNCPYAKKVLKKIK